MIQKEVQELIKQIAKKYNKPIYVIEEVFLSQWKFLKDKISNSKDDMEDFKTIKLPEWGKYYLSESKLAHIRRHNPEGKIKKKYGRSKDESSDQANT